MNRYKVFDPEDTRNPVPPEECHGLLLLYHGSSSAHADSIEKHGFDAAYLPYTMKDVQAVNRVYETYGWVGLGGGYSVTRWFTAGSRDAYVDRKPISFSSRYEYARNYAVNPGGETVHHVTVAIDHFERFAREPAIRRAHLESLKEHILLYPHAFIARTAYPGFLEASKDDRRVNADLESLQRIRAKFLPIVARHRALVYVVHANRGHFAVLPPRGETDFRVTSAVPPDLIFARIDFPNGIRWKHFQFFDMEEPAF